MQSNSDTMSLLGHRSLMVSCSQTHLQTMVFVLPPSNLSVSTRFSYEESGKCFNSPPFVDTCCQRQSGSEIVYRLLLSQMVSDGFQNVPFCSADQVLQGHVLLATATTNPPLEYLQLFPLPPSIFRGKRPMKD